MTQPTSPPLTPKFNDGERETLVRTHGLTSDQLKWLERHLGVILDQLGPHTPMNDVRDEIKLLARELAALSKKIKRWESLTRPSAGSEVLGHFNNAGANFVVLPDRPDDGTWPEVIVASELVKLLAMVGLQAVAEGPSKKRSRHPASAKAIATIVERLHRPKDTASRAAAIAIQPKYSDLGAAPDNAPSFRGVVDVVFVAIGRALKGHPGNISIGSPAASIQAYLDQLPSAARRPRGRPGGARRSKAK